MFPWTVPDELIHFILSQFERFRAPTPHDKVLDFVASHVINFVAIKNYYPSTAEEAIARYESAGGLTEPEKLQLLPPLEYHLKMQYHDLSINQIHLAAWAALLFCWSSQGDEHVNWYRTMEASVAFRY